MNKGKKILVTVLLTIFIILLIAAVGLLTVIMMKQKDEQTSLKTQLENLSTQKVQLENDLAKAKEEINDLQEIKTEDLNQEKYELIRKLLLEKMPVVYFNDSVPTDKYTVTGKYIDKVEIISEHNYLTESLNDDDQTKASKVEKINSIKGDGETIARVTYTTEFDKEIDKNDLIIAGNERVAIPYKNYIVQNHIVKLYRNESGEYEIELGTGGYID